jgi:hypothetical protein
MTSCLCLFIVERKTQITQFLIQLNLTLKLYPFLCVDITCTDFSSTWPKIAVHVNLTNPHPGAELSTEISPQR